MTDAVGSRGLPERGAPERDTLDRRSLDEDDLDLVAALQYAPRAPLSLLAEALDVSASTVGRRLARLESGRLLRVIGQLDWTVSGEGNPWHVWVAAEPGRAQEVARRLAELPEAQLVTTTAGQADVYCVVQPQRRSQARELLTRLVPATAGVRSARSELVLRAVAKSDSWRLPRLTAEQIRVLAGVDGDDDGETPAPGPLSEDDRRALQLLGIDGRMSAAQMARELKWGQSTAYRTVQSLLQRGVVRPRVEIEPELLGYALEAVVALTVTPGAVEEVAERLARHPSARYVSTTAGTSSVIHQGVFRNEDELAGFLNRDLADLPGLTSFEVSVVLEALRRHWLDRTDGLLAGTGRPAAGNTRPATLRGTPAPTVEASQQTPSATSER